MEKTSKSSSVRQARDFSFVLIVAGEASGDVHGANLVREMKLMDPGINFWGIGGERMRREGVRLFASSSEMAVVGLTEVFPKIGRILKASRELKWVLRHSDPDLLVLIDYPEFNLNLAAAAKSSGVPVLYYVSPQVWAWRSGRVKKIARRVDRMAVILPFEEAFYRERNVSVEYVGHPLMDQFGAGAAGPEDMFRIEDCPGSPVVGLLPGSREAEIRNLLPSMIKAAGILRQRHDSIRFLLPVAPTIEEDFVKSFFAGSGVDVITWRGDIYSLMSCCDAALVTSGTATLELAIMGVPMVIVYKVSPISYWAGRIVINVDHIGLVNLVAGKEVASELIQEEAKPEAMAEELNSILEDSDRRLRVKAELERVKELLGMGGASRKTAAIGLEMIEISRTGKA